MRFSAIGSLDMVVVSCVWRAVLPPSSGPAAPTVGLQAFPEHGDGFQDLGGPWKNFSARISGSKKTSSISSMVWPACWDSTRLCQVKNASRSWGVGLLDVEQAVLQFLPEPGGGPVLDGETRPGDLAVLGAESRWSSSQKQGRGSADRACPGR